MAYRILPPVKIDREGRGRRDRSIPWRTVGTSPTPPAHRHRRRNRSRR